MVEAHGWITLRYSDYHGENDEQRHFIARFKAFMHQHYEWVVDCKIEQTEPIGRITNRNGLECFTLTVQHNHAGKPFYPIGIFSWVAQNSTGSYGLLYFHDIEDQAHENEFQVFVLKRGKLVKASDSFLSPCLEEIEREYDPTDPPKD